MASLHDLHRDLFPTARTVGAAGLSAERGEREVHWVRVLRARVPAFEALDVGDLAIVAGPSLAIVAPDPPRIHELAVALARARVPAVLLVGGDTGGEALAALGTAVAETGLTALDLGRADPVALERSIIGFLVNRRAELDRRVAELEAQLARFALLGRGLEVQAATIGAFLGRAVVIEGRRGDALAIHVPPDLPTAAGAVARYLGHPSSGAILRVDIPAPAGQASPGGHLVLLGDEAPTDLERIAADRVAGLLALDLARDAAVRHAREETRRGDPLPEDGPPWVVMVARQGPNGAGAGVGANSSGAGAISGRPDPDELAAREATRAELRLLLPAGRLTLRGSAESLELRLVAAAPSDDPAGLQVADRLADVPPPDDRAVAAVHRAGRTAGRRGRGPGRPSTRPTGWPRRRPSPGRRGCPPTCCWGTCATCPTARARPASCWRRSSSGRRSDSATGSRRCARSSDRRASATRRRGSGSTATPSRTGSPGSSSWPIGTCPTRICGSRSGSRHELCKMHNLELRVRY